MFLVSMKIVYYFVGWLIVSGGLGIFNWSEIIEFFGDYVMYGFVFNIL